MIGIFGKNTPDPLDTPIAAVLAEIEQYGPDSEEYPKLISYLERLTRLKAETRPKGVSPDTYVTTAGTLFSVLIIVWYEHAHVLTSKALGLTLKKTA